MLIGLRGRRCGEHGEAKSVIRGLQCQDGELHRDAEPAGGPGGAVAYATTGFVSAFTNSSS